MANVSPTGRSWNLPCLHISTETTSWLKKMAEWLLTSLFSWVPQDNFSASLLPDPYHSGWPLHDCSDGCSDGIVHQWQQPHSRLTEVCWNSSCLRHQDHMERATPGRNFSPEVWTSNSDQCFRAEKRQETQTARVPLLLLIAVGLFIRERPTHHPRKDYQKYRGYPLHTKASIGA